MSAPTPIADMITEMLKNRIPIEMIIAAVRSMERAMSTRHPVDTTAEKRRAWDREYRRNKRAERPPDPPDIHPNPPDIGNVALSSLEEKESYSEVVSKKERKSRGSKIPPDWKPKQTHFDEAARRGLGPRDVEERAENMRTWCAANANRAITTKADWDATFMGFIRRDSNGNGIARASQGTGNHRTAGVAGSSATGADAVIAGMGRLADRVRERQLAERQNGLDLAGGNDPDGNGTVHGFEPRRSAG